MDKERLIEMKRNLAMEPILKERLENLEGELIEADKKVKSLEKRYEKEAYDVEKLQKESLSVMLLRFIGKFEDKVDKETSEMITAKLRYDNLVIRVNELKKQIEETSNRIEVLNRDKIVYETEVIRREEFIRSRVSGEIFIKYKELEDKYERFSKDLIEIKEAISAAKKVAKTVEKTIKTLEGADNWATYDAWTNGGLISHICKYDHIDKAQEQFNVLHSELKDLAKELRDINEVEVLKVSGISSTTKAIDFWFDNIFTDLNVLDKIRDDIKNMEKLKTKINEIINKLKNNEELIKRELKNIEDKKEELIISF